MSDEVVVAEEGQGTALVGPSDEFVGTTLTPEQYKRRREALLRFVKHQLEEAEYNNAGYINRVNDYYTVPGSSQLALSKKGAELLGDVYKYKIRLMEEVRSIVEKDFVSATYRCTLHRSNITVACREASCNTSEKGFQSPRVRCKYGAQWEKDSRGKFIKELAPPDYRAAENDVRARAQKRAYVNGMIAACAASDIFAVADEVEITDADYEVVAEEEPKVGGERLLELMKDKAFTDDEREKTKAWLAKKPDVKKIEDQIALAEDRILAKAETESGPLQ